MEKKWSNSWISSRQPRKQRKYVYNAPLHVKHKLVSAHLAPVLRERYGKRAVPLRKGDKVKVLRGESKGFTGSVERISLKKSVIFIEGLKVKKVDGTEVLKSVRSSNIMITELNTDDKRRQAKLLGKDDEKKPSKEKKSSKTVPEKKGKEENKPVRDKKEAKKSDAATKKVKK